MDRDLIKKWLIRMILALVAIFILFFSLVAISDAQRDKALKNKTSQDTASKVLVNAAEKAVTIYEETQSDRDLTKAQTAIERIADKSKKGDLTARVQAIASQKLLDAATQAVVTMETNQTVSHIQQAQSAVTQLADDETKADFERRIAAVIDSVVEQAVLQLESRAYENDLSTAQSALALLTDTSRQASYNERINAVMYRMADWYLKQLKATPTNNNYDGASKAVARLPEGEEKSAALTTLADQVVVVADAHVVSLEYYRQQSYVAAAQTAVSRMVDGAMKQGYTIRINRVVAEINAKTTVRTTTN